MRPWTLFAFAGCAFLVACGSSSTGGGLADDDAGSGPGGTTGSGGGTAGGAGKGGGATGTGGGSMGTGGGATGTGGGATGTGGGATGSGGGAPIACTPGTTPVTYTQSGVNNASWAGSGAPDTIVSTGNSYLPMTASDCPLDADMAVALPWKDKIFNGCLDDCGDGNNAGHGLATVIDWNHSSGWTTAQIASNLHWTGMWEPTTGSQPTTLVFWIKGAVGCEEDKFTIAIHAHGGNNNSQALKVPIAISQSWQRVVIPWANFKVLTTGNPDALTFVPTTAGKVTIFIDQAYLSKTVPPP